MGLATRAFQTRFGIKCYMRYVDNLFFVVKQDWVKIRALVDLVKCSNSMSPYTSKVEEASRQTINFLDVQIFKGSPDSFAAVPHFVATSSQGHRFEISSGFQQLSPCPRAPFVDVWFH